MSWQQDLFLVLRDRQWCRVGDLFELVEKDIPAHFATRQMMQRHPKRIELPILHEARWQAFRTSISLIGVETEQPRRAPCNGRRAPIPALEWNMLVRLAYLPERACPTCAGPVIKANWSARRIKTAGVVCLACEAAAKLKARAAPKLVAAAAPASKPPAPKPPAPKPPAPKPPDVPPLEKLTPVRSPPARVLPPRPRALDPIIVEGLIHPTTNKMQLQLANGYKAGRTWARLLRGFGVRGTVNEIQRVLERDFLLKGVIDLEPILVRTRRTVVDFTFWLWMKGWLRVRLPGSANE